ncbi:cation transporter [Halobacteriovorax marinus]|uniref:Cation transporter n=1 Tax=Halobacteriovorax marinus TaxID=97084 RepID=A0A1Y5FDJ1_9BACT|nr:cation transporter [Halobacteriovorax marinus]
MSKSCCQAKGEDLKLLAQKQKKVLWAVLIINAAMFFVEYISGFLSNSQALMADSLDMLGDSFAYATSLFVIGGTLRSKVKASQFKALLMVILGVSVFLRVGYRFIYNLPPVVSTMTVIGVIALVANLCCLFLLTRHKDDDINFSSVWICSRNDIIANTLVLVAAYLVHILHSPIPDLVVGLVVTWLFLKSAFSILAESKKQLQEAPAEVS